MSTRREPGHKNLKPIAIYEDIQVNFVNLFNLESKAWEIHCIKLKTCVTRTYNITFYFIFRRSLASFVEDGIETPSTLTKGLVLKDQLFKQKVGLSTGLSNLG